MAVQMTEDLFHAVSDNDSLRLTNLLTNGGDVNAFYEDTQNISSKSLLHVCCGKGHCDCLRILIDHGAQLDVRDKWGQTPLMYCATIQFPDNARLLLEASPALCGDQDRYGQSPLHCAVTVGSLEMVSLLLQFGADENLRNHDGFTPLMTACATANDENQAEIMSALISHGALVDLYDYRGKRTALHIAISAGNSRAVHILIQAGADFNFVSKDLRTPLTNAIFTGTRHGKILDKYQEIIESLVSSGADLGRGVRESCNSLLAAAQVKCASLVKFLLSNGANPNCSSSSGITAALVSASIRDLQTIGVLVKFNCDFTLQGSVYKRREDCELVVDPFQMALMDRNLDLCILMVLAGYPITRKWNARETLECFRIAFLHFVFLEDKCLISNEIVSITDLLSSTTEVKLGWLKFMSTTPRSLQDECVFTIRAALGTDVVTSVAALPLPEKLKDHIGLNDLLLCF